MLPTEPKNMDETKGIVGLILAILTPVTDLLNPAIQLAGALLGLILLIVSIKNRLLEKKKQQLEIKLLNQKLNQKSHESD